MAGEQTAYIQNMLTQHLKNEGKQLIWAGGKEDDRYFDQETWSMYIAIMEAAEEHYLEYKTKPMIYQVGHRLGNHLVSLKNLGYKYIEGVGVDVGGSELTPMSADFGHQHFNLKDYASRLDIHTTIPVHVEIAFTDVLLTKNPNADILLESMCAMADVVICREYGVDYNKLVPKTHMFHTDGNITIIKKQCECDEVPKLLNADFVVSREQSMNVDKLKELNDRIEE